MPYRLGSRDRAGECDGGFCVVLGESNIGRRRYAPLTGTSACENMVSPFRPVPRLRHAFTWDTGRVRLGPSRLSDRQVGTACGLEAGVREIATVVQAKLPD